MDINVSFALCVYARYADSIVSEHKAVCGYRIQGGPKNWHHCFVRLNVRKIVTDFQNYFTVKMR